MANPLSICCNSFNRGVLWTTEEPTGAYTAEPNEATTDYIWENGAELDEVTTEETPIETTSVQTIVEEPGKESYYFFVFFVRKACLNNTLKSIVLKAIQSYFMHQTIDVV